mmetsp:Transcript_100465/g.307035  ORF Transcript_100465/g.307035 Transcript_100465/m.307035 type:complete len:201 (+) Transcript_100465:516-1118(+)
MPHWGPVSLTITWHNGEPSRSTTLKDTCCRPCVSKSRTARTSSKPSSTTREGHKVLPSDCRAVGNGLETGPISEARRATLGEVGTPLLRDRPSPLGRAGDSGGITEARKEAALGARFNGAPGIGARGAPFTTHCGRLAFGLVPRLGRTESGRVGAVCNRPALPRRDTATDSCHEYALRCTAGVCAAKLCCCFCWAHQACC